jgi:putative phage-type endonuclease
MYQLIEVDQNTPAWLDWRKNGIGASDAPAVLGVSPYTKPQNLWAIKVGMDVDKPVNKYIMDKGHDFETRIRAKYEFESEGNWPSVCMQSVEFPYLRASLDGWNGKNIIEIKMVGAKMFASDDIPPHHYAQFQHQMMVSDAEDMTEIYGLIDEFNELKDKKRLVVRDEKFIDAMFHKEVEFWKMVTDKEWR